MCVKTSRIGNSCPVADPVEVGSGSKVEEETDFSTSGVNPLEFKRYYRALYDYSRGDLGLNWTSTYDRWLSASGSAPTAATVYRETGEPLGFTKSGSAWNRNYTDITGKLVEITAGSIYEYTDANDRTDRFQRVGTTNTYQLVQARWRNGYQQNLTYDSSGFLSTVTDSFGRSLSFTWAANASVFSGGRLLKVTAFSGQVVQFDYAPLTSGGAVAGSMYLLAKVSVLNADGSSGQSHGFIYDDPAHPGFMTGKVDGKGNRFETTVYDVNGRVTSTQHAGGAEAYTFAYDDVNNTRTVTNELGKVSVYHFSVRQGMFKLDSVDGLASTNCPASASSQTYDSNGFVASRTDWNGNLTTYLRDAQGHETSRTEAVGKPEQRTITTTWHATYNVPTRIVAPGKTTDLTWDSSGHLTQRTETDTTGGPSNGQTRSWSFTWTSTGLLQTVDGPRTDVTDVTTFAYDAQGYLSSVTNPLSQVTQITAKDARGLPLTIQDANGVLTDLSYDAMGRVQSRTLHGVADLTTQFSYDANGQISAVTLPNGSTLAYEYDAAHRLTAVQNLIGERVEFTLDAMGNRTATKVKAGTGSILRTQSQVFDELGRLLRSIGAASQTTAYQYDNNDNQVQVTDPRSAVTQQAFDALDRLVTSTDALTGQTQFTYDTADHLVQVTDPRAQTTTYSYDAWGDVLSQQSPDTGTTSYTVDAAGNRLSQTDARGVVVNYQYDALNRLTTKSFPANAAENVSFGYDGTSGGNKGIGRLTAVTDAAGSSAYVYDASGNLTNETRLVGTITYQTGYSYDQLGHLTSLQYPTGRIVSYDRDTLGRVTTIHSQAGAGAAPVVLAANIQYLPFGPVSGLTYGNGLQLSYQYDQDYRLTRIVTGNGSGNLQDLNLSYDGSSNITAIADAVTAGRSQSFQYDLLGRLTQAQGAYGTEGYTFDAVGNRLTKSVTTSGGSGGVNYTYAPTGNRLASLSNGSDTRAFSFDAAGNTTAETLNGAASYGYSYNNDNRLAQVAVAGGDTVTYSYNAFGERTIRSVANGDTHHLQYGPNGELIAETDAQGNALKSYVYLDGLPIALITGNSGGGAAGDVTQDDADAGTSSTGSWAVSTAGQGYQGAGHHLHAAPDPVALGGTVIDNGGAGFSLTGAWTTSTSGSGIYGANYLTRSAAGANPQPIIIDNSDAAFTTTGTWSTGSADVFGLTYGTNYRYKSPNDPSAALQVADDTNASLVTKSGTWTAATSSDSNGGNFQYTLPVPGAGSIIVDNTDPGFSTISGENGWIIDTNSTQYGSNYIRHRGNGLKPTAQIVDDSNAGFSASSNWSTVSASDCINGTCRFQSSGTPSGSAIYIDNTDTTNFSTVGRWDLWTNVSDCYGSTCLYHPVNDISNQATVIDNTDPSTSAVANVGNWPHMTYVSNYWGSDFQTYGSSAGQTNTGATFTWPLNVATAGSYKVWVRYEAWYQAATNATYTIYSDAGATNISINQRSGGANNNRGKFTLLGTFNLTPGQNDRIVLSGDGNGVTIADAVAFEPANLPTPKAVWQLPVQTAGAYTMWVRYHSPSGLGSGTARYTVYGANGSTSTISHWQAVDGGTWYRIGTFNLAPGQNNRVELPETSDGDLSADAIAIDPVDTTSKAVWQLPVQTAGNYRVLVHYHTFGSPTHNSTYAVYSDSGVTQVSQPQYYNGGIWTSLGNFNLTPGQNDRVELPAQWDGSQVSADAVAIDKPTDPGNTATWTPSLPSAGNYRVYIRWPARYIDANTSANYTITYDGGTAAKTFSQQWYGMGYWQYAGTYAMTPGSAKVSLSDIGGGVVRADAVAFEPVSATDGAKMTWTPQIAAAGKYLLFQKNPISDAFANNTLLSAYSQDGAATATVNQATNSNWRLLGLFNMAPGQNNRVEVTTRTATGELANGEVIGDAVGIEPYDSVGNGATWTPTLTQPDKYEVFARWYGGAATDAKYFITHAGIVTEVTVDQSKRAGEWVSLGIYDFTPGTGDKIQLSDHANGTISADAIELKPVVGTERFATWQGTATTAGSYQVYARWPVASTLAMDAKYKLTTPTNISTVAVNQRQGGGSWHLLGTVSLAANDNWRVDISDQASGAVAADAVAVVPAATADSFTWSPTLPTAGKYQVFANWSAAPDRASDASYQIHSSSGTSAVTVDQRQASVGWHYLGTYDFDPATAPSVSLLSSPTGSVSADALRFVGSGNLAGVSFILSDQVGQPQKLTDENANVTWDRVSTPYGETYDLQNPGNIDQPQRFPGQQLDNTTSLAYNYFRDYDPSLGRYIQSDPIGLDGGLNTYAYVGGNPVNRVDPYGQFFFVDDIAEGVIACAAFEPCDQAVASAGLLFFGAIISEYRNHWHPAFCPRPAFDSNQFPHILMNEDTNGQGPRRLGDHADQDKGCIYCVPGEATQSGKDYIGRTDYPGDREKVSSDGRDRTKAEVVDTYPKGDTEAGKAAEQKAMNDRGGVKNLDNGRNEIAPKKWPAAGISPPK